MRHYSSENNSLDYEIMGNNWFSFLKTVPCKLFLGIIFAKNYSRANAGENISKKFSN